ncbi:MAG: hypothetical protein M2R45_05229 [Verrucomicrobia subdivision 3 bacterium]|nr:hypothetical protein [Limisphaerales bacterium]MCS1417462.1 hypothetical protein [Limisphaerales bacterium]
MSKRPQHETSNASFHPRSAEFQVIGLRIDSEIVVPSPIDITEIMASNT